MSSGRALARIDLQAVAANLSRVQELVGERPVIAVVKADAYGHGLELLAPALARAGASRFGVASLDEALELRRLRLGLPIFILGSLPLEAAEQAVAAGFEVALHSWELAEALERAGRRLGRRVPVHLKLDTGMSRLGLAPEELERGRERLRALGEVIDSVGLFTTLATGEDAKSCQPALEALQRTRQLLQGCGLRRPMLHAANSAGVSHSPETHLDAVRPGLMLYGVPAVEGRGPALQPVLSLEAPVVQVREVPPGTAVGYGGSHLTSTPTRLATLAIGYADGLRRGLSNRAEVLLHGVRAPLVGYVSMDLCVCDVSELPAVRVGDRALLLGRDGDQQIDVWEWARRLGSIPWEMLTGISARVPRVPVRQPGGRHT